jgi:hypothetical protein
MLTRIAYPRENRPVPPAARGVTEIINSCALPAQVIAFVRDPAGQKNAGVFAVIDNRDQFIALSETTAGLPFSVPHPEFRIPRGAGTRRPSFPVKAHGSTRSSLERFRNGALRRGFNFVATLGGPVRIRDWQPWGLFHASGPDHEPHYGGLRWCWPNVAHDLPVTRGWLALGLWRFLVDPSDCCSVPGIHSSTYEGPAEGDAMHSAMVTG